MKFFATFVLVTILFTQVARAEEEMLQNVSAKLTEINQRLKDQRVFITSAAIKWPELDAFKEEIMFTVAHDPYGTIDKTIPQELNPSFLTQKLKGSWSDLEISVIQMDRIGKSTEWTEAKTEIENFFALRDKSFYQPARKMVSSGLLFKLLDKVKADALTSLKETNTTKDVSVKVIDPVIEQLSRELSVMNSSVRDLVAFKTPPPVTEPAFLNRIHKDELFALVGVSFLVGTLVSLSLVWISSRTKKVAPETKEKVTVGGFNYYQWLKQLEASLLALKENEDKNCEELIKLKEFAEKLHVSRNYLNAADNQQDYYVSIDELNKSAPQIEQYFEKINLRKDSELSRRLIKQVIQLCDAIESKKEVLFEEDVPKLKLIKLEKISHLKVA